MISFGDGDGNELQINTSSDARGDLIAFHITRSNEHHLHIALSVNHAITESLSDITNARHVYFEDGFGNRLEVDTAETDGIVDKVIFSIKQHSGKSGSIGLPIGMVPDVLEFIEWIIKQRLEEPRFISRARKGGAYARPDAKIQEILQDLALVPDDDVAKILMNLAGRNRVDLAVELLTQLGRQGRFREAPSSIAQSYYPWETPANITWAQLSQWAGISADMFVEVSTIDEPVSDEYQPYDYVACFENAFGGSLEELPFEMMDFHAEQAGLRRLSENLDRYFKNVTYPQATQEQIIPYIVGEPAVTEGSGFESVIQFNYTTPVWYEEARKYLLFAHKLCFEDPLAQVIDPITRNINNRSFQFEDLLVEPAGVHPLHFELLRQTLVNVKRMATLIRRGIVIPHCLKPDRLPDYSPGDSLRFPDETSYSIASHLAYVLGSLMATGQLDNFRLPDYLIRRAKQVRKKWDWEFGVDWFWEIFDYFPDQDEIDPHDRIREWPNHLYRIALLGRYVDAHQLGFSPHFFSSDGYQIYSILEAADLRSTLMQKFDPLTAMRTSDEPGVLISYLPAGVEPKPELSDDDLIKLRLEEDLFEEWRSAVSRVLTTVRRLTDFNFNQQDQARAFTDQMREEFESWETRRSKELKKSARSVLWDLGIGGVISFISGGILSALPSALSLGLDASLGGVKEGAKIFTWRRKGDLVKRHFLSVG